MTRFIWRLRVSCLDFKAKNALLGGRQERDERACFGHSGKTASSPLDSWWKKLVLLPSVFIPWVVNMTSVSGQSRCSASGGAEGTVGLPCPATTTITPASLSPPPAPHLSLLKPPPPIPPPRPRSSTTKINYFLTLSSRHLFLHAVTCYGGWHEIK